MICNPHVEATLESPRPRYGHGWPPPQAPVTGESRLMLPDPPISRDSRISVCCVRSPSSAAALPLRGRCVSHTGRPGLCRGLSLGSLTTHTAGAGWPGPGAEPGKRHTTCGSWIKRVQKPFSTQTGLLVCSSREGPAQRERQRVCAGVGVSSCVVW